MLSITLKAYCELHLMDYFLWRGELGRIYDRVRNSKTDLSVAESSSEIAVCSAVNVACIWYWKPVQCLQRSAVTTSLLKKAGIAAKLVLGVQHVPFRAHAWVEVNGRVVNDLPYVNEIYSTLDICH